MIIVGDTHGNFDALNKLLVSVSGKNIIVCGDFGYWKTNQGYIHDSILPSSNRIFFCDGNHEDFLLLKKYRNREKPVCVDKQRNIYYCPRGSDMKLEGKMIMFFGGAKSYDQAFRTLYYDWFPEEIPSKEDFLKCKDKHYDVIVSHTCPEILFGDISRHIQIYYPTRNDFTSTILQKIYERYHPEKWYFGHWHTSMTVNINGTEFHCMDKFNEISKLEIL